VRSVLDGIKKSPHPEEVAERPSRRAPVPIQASFRPDDGVQSHLWEMISPLDGGTVG